MTSSPEKRGTYARILLDSITDGGSRLTTWELRYPRSIHAAVMTYRACGRNGASSRAIPAKKKREDMLADIAFPAEWGKNQKGMQAREQVDEDARAHARLWFERSARTAAALHEQGELLGLHKQIVNRLIEPFEHMTIVLTATQDFHANMLHQRLHRDADPSFQRLARCVDDQYFDHCPAYVAPGAWHLPLIREEDWDEILRDGPDMPRGMGTLIKVSVARCARVSYLTHDGRRDIQEDLALYDRLLGTTGGEDPGHFSPFEHACYAVGDRLMHGPFEGWKSHRSLLPGEAGPDTRTDRCEVCGVWGGRHARQCPEHP